MIDDLAERSADPARVRSALDRLPHARSDLDAVAAPLVAVIAASRSLTRVLATDDAALATLRPDAPRIDPPTALDELVTWKRRELLRIAARDLTGADSLEVTTAALADLAADVLQVVAATTSDTVAPGDRMAIIGMGKLGGTELNYASDVDVLFVGDGDIERLERWARGVVDRAKRAFRIDVDLRPEGRDGPLVRTLASYESYWERWAEPWERQALLKARPVAGDVELGEAWAQKAGLVLWGQPFGADDLRYVRALKVRSEQEMTRGAGDRDVKHGRGGIRDIEFAVQLLQLVHGRLDAELRERGTLRALEDLRRGGYVDPDDADRLDASYRFLRRVEHVVQLEDERQVHAVPADRDDRRRLARVLGFRGTPDAGPTEAFDLALTTHRLQVRGAHERVWFRPLLESLSGAGPLGEAATAERLAAFGFTDVERTRQAVAELTRGLTRSSRMMQQLLPLLLDWLSASPDPDLGLLGLRRLASGDRRSRALATTFRDSPEVARHLALLLGTSRYLGDVLLANPDLIERLPHPSRLQTLPRTDLVASAHRVISWREGLDEQQRALQRWKQRHLLGIAARDVFAHADVEQVGADLTRLAEASLECALEAVDPQVPTAIVAFGRLGGGEVGYASDLDLAFVHDGVDSTEAERIAAAVLRYIGGDTPAERIWAVDADLRPEGRSGPLSRTMDGWEGYLTRWVSTWERQAYLRARVVAGDADLGNELVGRLRDTTLDQPFTGDDEREVRRMKVRIERERMRPGDDPEFHLKLGKGSLSDIEFTVQLLQLRHGLVEPSTMVALAGLVEAGYLPLDEAEVLEASYRFCEGTRNRAFLVAGSGDALPSRPELVTPVARSLGLTVSDLRERYRRVTRRARRVVERRFYGRA